MLVLSRFAGAAEELPEAIIINPLDVDAIADSLETALAMPLAERRERWRAMFETLTRNDVATWCAAFVRALAAD